MSMDSIPAFLYGTAWKEERTEDLVIKALNAGFVGIDTANQRKHYFEEGVGKGIQHFLKTSGKKREDLFLQTKFTYVAGQDHRLPYDDDAEVSDQVRQSFDSSLNHLQTNHLDSYVLHGPYGYGVHEEDFLVWGEMEKLHREGKVKHLGISNVALSQLEEIYDQAEIKPEFIQNRCYARTFWNQDVRHFCKERGMIYQGFSLLTANIRELSTPLVQNIARKYQKTIPQITFKFSQQIGMLPLTGTSNFDHMKLDLDIDGFSLDAGDLDTIENISSQL